MKRIYLIVCCICAFVILLSFEKEKAANLFPDGTRIPDWFSDVTKVKLEDLGTQYKITDFGAIVDSTILQTEVIQKAIDRASNNGGGVIIIPKGTFLSGALFFKPNTHLYLSQGSVLKGSDSISIYPKIPSRMEGQNLDYFAALVNAYKVDGFTISGKGTIDGNGLNYWKAFWERRKENPKCTNLEVSRPRLVFIWDSDNVQLQDIKLINSGFWSSHYYQCNNVKILDLHISSPHEPIKAPSTDAIDLDVCSNVLIKGCYMAVNDDAIALKGGKGPWANTDERNGENTNIIIEDCVFGFCHSALTCGSESIHNRNILMRNCQVDDAMRLLWFKMRPDTPQKYEFITVENIKGYAKSMIYIKPWTQFFDLNGKEEVPLSYCDNITMRNIELDCDVFFDMKITEFDYLSNFVFENLKINTKNSDYNKSIIDGVTFTNVVVNNKVVQLGNQQRSSLESTEIINEIHNSIFGDTYRVVAFYQNSRGEVPVQKKAAPPEGLDWELFQEPVPRREYTDNTWDYNWHWYGWDYGTAEMGNNASHELDIARWALDVKYPEYVSVYSGKFQFKEDGWEMYDTMEATYRFSGNKTIQWDGQIRNGYDKFRSGRGTIIYGSKGSVYIDRSGYKLYDLKGKLLKANISKVAEVGTALGGGNLSTLHTVNFFDVISGKATLKSPIDEGAISQMLNYYANIASRIDNSFEVDEQTGRIFNREDMKLWSRNYDPGWEIKQL